MNFEPKQLTFRDVRLNQAYTTSLCITNPLTAAVEFTLRASSPRYSISPNRVVLNPNQSIVVTIRLFLNHYPNVQKGLQGQEDSIHIKSPYFDQKVQVDFFLHNQSARSRSASPIRGTPAGVPDKSRPGTDLISDLNAQLKVKDHRIEQLQSIVANLESKHPNLEEIVRAKIEKEREVFEEKSEKILKILRRKDEMVESLQRQLEESTRALQGHADASQIDANLQTLAEGKSRDYWTGRSLSITPAAGTGNTHRELVDMLEQTKRALDDERQAHNNCRNELHSAYSTIEELNRSRGSSESGAGSSSRLQPHEWKELRGLREQAIDQTEEIKSLMTELSKLRRDAQEQATVGEDLQQARREISRLRGDVAHQQKKYSELEAVHEALQSAHEALEELHRDESQRLHAMEAQQSKGREAMSGSNRSSGGAGAGGGRVSWQGQGQGSDDHHQTLQPSSRQQPSRRDSSRDRNGPSDRAEAPRDTNQQQQSQHQSQQDIYHVDGSRFEESVGGGMATSTPTYFALHPPETTQQAIHEKNNLIALYQDRMERYEEEIERLKGRVSEGQDIEKELRERLSEVETKLQGWDQEGRLLSERVERLKGEKEATAHEVQDKEIQLQSALERASQHETATAVNDAHLWWAYIWHAMKQQQDTALPSSTTVVAPGALNLGGPFGASGVAKPDNHFISEMGASGPQTMAGTNGAPQPGNYDFKPTHDAGAAVHDARLRDNLRAQAIEIAQLRQELIGRKLTYKKEMDAIKEQNETFQREIVRLQAQSRVHRADKDLKIAELAATVRTLSVRGDMHAQAAAARQEVEAEKLTNHHLRADVDSYRLMLEEEQRKLLGCRKEVANLQAQIDSSLVLQSVVNVPGVSPATLIELMAGEITQLESEVAKSRASAAESSQQLRALQRTVNMAQQQRRQAVSDTPPTAAANINSNNTGGPSPANPRRASVGANGPAQLAQQRSRSLSPAGGRRASVGPGASALRHSASQLSLRSSLEGDFGADDLNQSIGDEDGFAHTPLRTGSPLGGTFSASTPFSVVVDGEATPKMVVESLDRAVLAQRVMSQEATIAELNAMVEELQTKAMSANREHLIAKDAAEESDRIEWERSMRKQDLLQTLLDESRSDIKKLQQRNTELEKTLSNVHAARMLEGFNPRAGGGVGGSGHSDPNGNNSVFFEDAPLMGNHTSDMGSYAGAEVNYEENLKELESTKILLRERTTQLKVIMETLDSLQLIGIKAGSKFHAEDEALFNRRPGSLDSQNISGSHLGEGFGGLNLSGGRGGTSMEGTWGMQALVKRVVELTTELTSQCAVASLEARKAEDLELANRRQAKEINKLKLNMRNLEDSASRATLQLNTMCNQLQEGDRGHIEAMAALRSENDSLATALRETEAALDASEIRVSSLAQQAELADQSDFMGWLEFVTLDNQKIVTDGSIHSSPHAQQAALSSSGGGSGGAESAHHNVIFNNMKIGESSVRDLVVNLVLQWKEYVGTVPQMKPMTSATSAVPKLSKADQRFLQRVTDMVMNSNDCATKAQLDAQAAQARIKQVEHANQIATERLQICASHLNRYRKRCHAFEKVLSVDRKHTGLKQGKLESLLRETVSDLRAKNAKAMNIIRGEKRDRMINEVKRAMEAQQLRKLQAHIAELEARGTSTLRARDEAVASLESKLKSAEESMYKWFKVELPRLVSGLPATEDTLASYYNENINPNYGVDPSPFGMSEENAPISSQLLSSLGMDRTYALSQALCSSKAAMTVQEMRISGLTEKLSILKERNLALEGVIIRWKDEIQQSTIAATVPSVGHNASAMMQHLRPDEIHGDGLDQYLSAIPSQQGHAATMGNANRVDAAIQQVYTYAEAEAELNTKVQELTERLIELEEENIEMRGKFEQANARAAEMKALVDVVMGDEQQLKTKATQQLTKIRLNLEKEHAEELRKIRQSYESEKNKLLGELEAVANAVEEAKLTTVDTTAWQRLVAGGEDESKGGDRFYGTQPRPTPIRSYVPTPPYANSDQKGLNYDDEAAEERKEARKEKKNKQTRKQKKASSKGGKHRRKHHDTTSSSSSSDSGGSNNGSSSSSSSGSDSDSDSLQGGKGGDAKGRSRRHHRHRHLHQQRGDADEEQDRHVDMATTSTALNTSAAQAYAGTLHAQQQVPQTAPRPRARTAARDPMDVRPTPSSASSGSSNASVSLSYINQQQDLAEVQVENLERMLEMERRKHEETNFEMAELQQLLQIQQSVFREHLGAQPGGPQPSAAAPVINRGDNKAAATVANNSRGIQNLDRSLSTFNDDSFSTPSDSPSEQQQQQTQQPKDTRGAVHATADTLQGIIREVQREDAALWPSLSSLVDELMSVLQGLSEHTRSDEDRTDARTALAMAARIKVVCSTSSGVRNIATTAAEANTKGQSSFHADQLLEELHRYGAPPAQQKQRPQDDNSVTSINFRTLASFGNSATEGGDGGKEYTGHLQSLANRVKMMESDFKDDNIPERHLYLMRDLRMRVLELEKTLSEELLSQRNQWAAERTALTRKAQENADLAEQYRQGQNESMATMRTRYEEALRNAEEALESSTRAATQEVTRLELLLAQQTNEKTQLQARLQAELAKPAAERAGSASAGVSAGNSISSATGPQPSVARPVVAAGASSTATAGVATGTRAPSPALTVPETSQRGSALFPSVSAPPAAALAPPPPGATTEALNEFLRMQRLVDQTGDHLEHTRLQRQQIEMHHAREVAELKSHFARYRRAQSEVVRSLEDQLEDLHEKLASVSASSAAPGGVSSAASGGNGAGGMVNRNNVDDSLAGGRSMASQVNSIAEAEDVIRKMEFKFRIMSAELEAVMRTLSRMTAGGADDTMASEDQSSLGGNTTYTFDVPDMSVRPLQPPASRYSAAPSISATSTMGPRSSRDGGRFDHTGGECDDFGVLNNEHFDSVARDMQTELYEARILTCEKEIEALHRNLQKERTLVASLKTQLQSTQEHVQQQVAHCGGKAPRSTNTTTTAVGAGASATQRGQQKSSEEQPAATQAAADTSSIQHQQGGEPHMSKARIASRRGSTGSIHVERTSSGIPTFAPAASATSSASTGAGAAVAGGAAPDTINDFSQDYVVLENPNDPEKTRLLVRRMNEMRRSARAEISRLKEQITALKAEIGEEDGSKKGSVADLKMQLAHLKEENSRKTKLVNSLKSAKTAEDVSLEQWKFEAGQQEENCKRLQRAVSSKEAMIKDLKAKVEGLENAMAMAQREGVVPTTPAHPHGAHSSVQAAPGLGSPSANLPVADLSTMPAAELRTRLRASELERARNRTRMQALREKVTELEAELGRLQDENLKLQKLGERAESMKGAITRKDSMIQQLKTQVEKLQVQVDNLKTSELMLQAEADKKEQQLKRRVESAEHSRRELEHESQLMRMRLTDAATREQTNIEVRRSSDASRRFNDGTSTSGAPFSSAPSREKPPTGSATGDRSTTPSRATAVQQRRASVGSSSTPSGGGRDAVGADLAPPRRSSTFTQQQSQQQHQEQSQGQQISGLPGPLSSATNDLQDVINALGVGPLHLGLGVNPRSSVVSGAYTHNTSGRGSTMDRENLMSLGEASTSSGEGGSGGGAEVSSVEKRFKSLVSTALKSPVRQRRL